MYIVEWFDAEKGVWFPVAYYACPVTAAIDLLRDRFAAGNDWCRLVTSTNTNGRANAARGNEDAA